VILDRVLAYGRTFARVLPRRHAVPTDLLRLMIGRPALLGAVGTYETALLLSGRVDSRLKSLAMLKSSALIGCPF
jgi:hypothetical protein